MRSGNDEWSIKKLTENIKAADQVVRLHAATVLGSLGDEAEAAVPTLIGMLENGDVQDRRLPADRRWAAGLLRCRHSSAIGRCCDAFYATVLFDGFALAECRFPALQPATAEQGETAWRRIHSPPPSAAKDRTTIPAAISPAIRSCDVRLRLHPCATRKRFL
jgi:hypothetical protein